MTGVQTCALPICFSAIYSYVGLAELYIAQGYYTLALHTLQQAFTLSEDPYQVQAVNYCVIADFMSLLGDQLTHQGRVAQAQLFYQRATIMRKGMPKAD